MCAYAAICPVLQRFAIKRQMKTGPSLMHSCEPWRLQDRLKSRQVNGKKCRPDGCLPTRRSVRRPAHNRRSVTRPFPPRTNPQDMPSHSPGQPKGPARLVMFLRILATLGAKQVFVRAYPVVGTTRAPGSLNPSKAEAVGVCRPVTGVDLPEGPREIL